MNFQKIRHHTISFILALACIALVGSPMSAFADPSKSTKSKIADDWASHKKQIQTKLQNLGDYFEKREFDEGISVSQIQSEIIANLKEYTEQRKKALRDKQVPQAEELIQKLDAQLALDIREITADEDFNPKDYFYRIAERLDGRDVNGIPFENSDEWYESMTDVLILLIGGAIVVGIIFLIIWASDDDPNCTRHWQHGYYDPWGYWVSGHYYYTCTRPPHHHVWNPSHGHYH